MSGDDAFRALMRRVRAGDEAAAAELVRQYEPAIRRAVRLHLTDPALGRVLDSMDVCQSVLANFFVRAAAGQFELDEPGQLVGLLVTMARNKLLDQVRKQRAGRRDHRRLETTAPEALDAVPAAGQTPSAIVAGKELLDQVRGRLSEPERYLMDQRALGRDWAALAAEVGGSPDALRKQLARALDRVARELGLDEVAHD
jgi:RNA polymerase sigma-70 factor (ECF subfamily)